MLTLRLMRLSRILPVWLAVLAFSLVAFKGANSAQPPVGYTGAPNDNGTCRNCHSGGSPAPTITLKEQGGTTPTTYTPGGSQMTLQVVVTHPTASTYGFQVTVVDQNGGNAPNQTLATSGQTNTTLQTGSNGRKYIAHQSASSINTWTFRWTPPANNIGPITWYVAANAANGNGATSGDAIGTLTLTLQPATATALEEGAASISPLRWEASALRISAPAITATLYTLEGREVATLRGEGLHPLALRTGVYVCRWEGQGGERGFMRLWIP